MENIIRNITDRRDYNMQEQGRYEAMHGEHVADGGSHASIWSEMAEWHKGKVVAFNLALEIIQNEMDAA
jgi:hypothetical protein